MKLDVPERIVVVLDQGEIEFDALSGIGLFEGFGDSCSVGLVGALGGRRSEVLLMVGVLDMGEAVDE